LREKIPSGWVATTLPEGAKASAHFLVSWNFGSPTHVSADDLYAEVCDTVERLAGRPTSLDRCLEALDRLSDTRLESDRQILADAYLAVPSANRMFMLGDQDNKDRPVRMLAMRVGELLVGDRGNPRVVTEEDHKRAFEYFAARKCEVEFVAKRKRNRETKAID
jgi:hypothetical protein